MSKNDERKTRGIRKSVFIFIISFLLAVPLMLNGIFSGDLSGAWIGFWGSFAGGILGTLGVIYVAHLQNEENRKLNKEQYDSQIKSMAIVENNNRERLRTETEIFMLKEYSEDIEDVMNTMLVLNDKIIEIIHCHSTKHDLALMTVEKNEAEIQKNRQTINENVFFIKSLDVQKVITKIRRIESMNLVMSDVEIELQEELLSATAKDSFKEIISYLANDGNSLYGLEERFSNSKNKITGLSEIYDWLHKEETRVHKSMINLLNKLGKEY